MKEKKQYDPYKTVEKGGMQLMYLGVSMVVAGMTAYLANVASGTHLAILFGVNAGLAMLQNFLKHRKG